MIKNRIAELRNSLHLSQKQLADRAKVNRAYLSTLETGHSMPSVELAGRIAKALSTTIDELFFGQSVRHNERDDDSKKGVSQ